VPQSGQAGENPCHGLIVGPELVTVVQAELLERLELRKAFGARWKVIVEVPDLAICKNINYELCN
jgi:uncharacterized protein YqgC (DUF456 family)